MPRTVPAVLLLLFLAAISDPPAEAGAVILEGGDVLHGPRRGHRVVVIQDYGLARHRGRGGSQGHASSRGL